MVKIVMYGAEWCPDVARSRRYLELHKVHYEYHDIDKRPDLADLVITYNERAGFGKKRRIPLILIGERVLSEPSDEELGAALGLIR